MEKYGVKREEISVNTFSRNVVTHIYMTNSRRNKVHYSRERALYV